MVKIGQEKNLHLQKGATIGGSIRVQDDGFELDGPNDGRISITEQFGVSATNSRVYAHLGGTCGHPPAIEVGNLYGGAACYDDNVGIAIFMLEGEAAIRCGNGLCEGLRPKIRTITASSTTNERDINRYDHTIMVASSSGINLYLTSDASIIGQEIVIMMSNSGDTSVLHGIYSLQGCQIINPAAGSSATTSISVAATGVVKLVCANDASGSKKWWLYRLA